MHYHRLHCQFHHTIENCIVSCHFHPVFLTTFEVPREAASPGCSKVMYAVKKTEWETAWERGYIYASPYTIQNFSTCNSTVYSAVYDCFEDSIYIIMVVTTVNAQL